MKNRLDFVVSILVFAGLVFCFPCSLVAAACDVNGDGQEGLPEAIHALQVATGNIPGPPTCPQGLTECLGFCVNTANDPSFCGDCQTDCGAENYCDNGTCKGLTGTACTTHEECSTSLCFRDVCTAAKLVFVSSSSHTGNLGGLSGADSICQGLASSADLPGTYKAWLSDSTQSPSTRFAKSTIPYIRVDGAVVALNWTDLTDAQLSNPIVLDENGALHPEVYVQTGTRVQGQAEMDIYLCEGWHTAALTVRRYIGISAYTDNRWTNNFDTSCYMPIQMYCFQQ